MKDTKFSLLGSDIRCALKIKNLAEIPMYEELTEELLFLMDNQENERRIRKLFDIAKIEIINYDEDQHLFQIEDEIVIDIFWCIINQVKKTEEPKKVRYLKNILYYVQNNRGCDLGKMKSFVDLVMNYSILHFEVLWSIDGFLDYAIFKGIPLTNALPETLAECLVYTVSELWNEYDKRKQIWSDLLEAGLRKDIRLHMRIDSTRFGERSYTSRLGKEFLEVAVNHSLI